MTKFKIWPLMLLTIVILHTTETKVIDKKVDKVGAKAISSLDKAHSSNSPDVLSRLVGLLADAEIITKEDAEIFGTRQSRDNPLTDLAFSVFKEVVSDFLTYTVGSFLGLETERSDEEFNLISMILAAVRKNTLQKRMGCPV